MAFHSPPSRFVIASPSNERNTKTPSDTTGESACVETDLSLSTQHKYSSNDNLIQRQPSITELDRIQRLRREQTERHNADLPSMECGHSDAEFSFPPLSFAQIEEPIEQGSNQGPPNHSSLFNFSTSRKRRGTIDRPKHTNCGTRAKRVPAPKLRVRSYQNLFHQDQDAEPSPKIILNAEDEEGVEEKFGDLFPSPHSNKFVLQFPDAPLQELTLDDIVDSPVHDDDLNIQGQEQAQAQPQDWNYFEQEHEIAQETCMPINSPECFSLRTVHLEREINKLYNQDNISQGSVQSLSDASASASASTSPILGHYRKKKIMLKPKKRSQGLGRKQSIDAYAEDIDADSACSYYSSASSFEGSNDGQGFASGEARSLDQMTSSLNRNGGASGGALPMRSQKNDHNNFRSRNQCGNRSAFLSLRPKSLKVTKFRGPYDDESGDVVMELDPNLSVSRDLDIPYEENWQKHGDGIFTPHRLRSPSVSFIGDFSCENMANRGRTESSHSVQDQIEMAIEAAARFGGLSERSASLESFISPSNLSESNFRTPNPSSARSGRTPQEEEKKRMVGLFLPKFEDDMPGAAPISGLARRGRPNSYFELMKAAFSPTASFKKSPVS
jgi:hypothetical protein